MPKQLLYKFFLQGIKYIQGMIDNFSPFSIINFTHVPFCFRFCLLFWKLERVWHWLWRKQNHDTIRSSSVLETARFTARHSRKKRQYGDMRVFGCPYQVSFISILIKTKHLVNIMAFGMATNDGGVIPSFIFPPVFTFNTEAYIKCQEDVMLAWIVGVVAGRPYIQQEISAPGHRSRIQSWEIRNFWDYIIPNIWLPNFNHLIMRDKT